MSQHRLEIAYADHRDNRMIIIGGAVFDDLEEQEREFSRLPAETDSDFIVDYYDASGCISKDKYVSQATVEVVMGKTASALISQGRRRENAFTKYIKANRKRPSTTVKGA